MPFTDTAGITPVDGIIIDPRRGATPRGIGQRTRAQIHAGADQAPSNSGLGECGCGTRSRRQRFDLSRMVDRLARRPVVGE
jgi:hypothetical protein